MKKKMQQKKGEERPKRRERKNERTSAKALKMLNWTVSNVSALLDEMSVNESDSKADWTNGKRSANNIYPKLNMYVDFVKVYRLSYTMDRTLWMIPLQLQNRSE